MAIKEEILFTSNFDKAKKSLSKFGKDASKDIGKVSQSFFNLKNLAIAAGTFLAGRQILRGLGRVTDAAAFQEQAIQNLNTALSLAGDFSVQASQDMQKFASQIQQTSKFGDELVLNQIAIAKSFGVSNEEARKLVAAAVDLSAATGKSLESSVINLGKTLGGLTGELGESVPALRGLGAEALKSGAAIELVTSRFGGAALKNINTYDGAVTQLGNTFGDTLEEIGFFIVKNPVITATVKAISESFGELNKVIAAERGSIIKSFSDAFIENLQRIIEFIPTFAKIINVTLVGVINGAQIALNGLSGAVDTLGLTFATLQRLVLATQFGFAKLFKSADEVEEIRLKWVEATEVQQGFVDSLAKTGKETTALGEEIAKSLDSKIPEPLQKALDLLSNKLTKIKTDVKAAGDDIGGLGDGGKEFEFTVKTLFDGTAVDQAFSSVKDFFSQKSIDEKFKSFKDSVTGLKDLKIADIGNGILEAGKFIIDGIAAIGPGLASVFSGGAVNEFSGIVKQIGDAPKAFLEAFKNLDGIIQGLLETLPQVIDNLIGAAPAIIQRIIESIPALVQKFIQGLSAIATIIADSAPALVGAILDGITALVDAIPDIVDKLVSALPAVLRAILQKLPALISAILRAIPKIIGSIARAIPELIVVFLEELPGIVLALVQGIIEAIPEIIDQLVDAFITKGGLLKIVVALIKAVPAIAIAMAQGILRGLTNGLTNSFANLGKVFSSNIKLPKFPTLKFDSGVKDLLNGNAFRDKLNKLFGDNPFFKKLQEIFDKFNPFSGGGGGSKKGPVTGVKGSPIATGGLIPPGFPNDTFPARLTSGELVVPTGDVPRLSKFLDNQENASSQIAELARMIDRTSEKNVTVTIQVGEENLASTILNLNRRGFRTA